MNAATTARPPALVRRGAWFNTPDAEALARYLDQFPNLHRWQPRALDTRRPREPFRWYERAPGLGRVEPAAIVIDRRTPQGHWVRCEGDAARVLPILAELVAEEPAQVEAEPVEQLGLFAEGVA